MNRTLRWPDCYNCRLWRTKRHIVRTFLPPQQDFSKRQSPSQRFKLTLSQKSFCVFRKDRQCKFIFLLSPSLDLINIISVRALEAMKVAGETLQRSRRTSPAAGSYLQPCVLTLNIKIGASINCRLHSILCWTPVLSRLGSVCFKA